MLSCIKAGRHLIHVTRMYAYDLLSPLISVLDRDVAAHFGGYKRVGCAVVVSYPRKYTRNSFVQVVAWNVAMTYARAVIRHLVLSNCR